MYKVLDSYLGAIRSRIETDSKRITKFANDMPGDHPDMALEFSEDIFISVARRTLYRRLIKALEEGATLPVLADAYTSAAIHANSQQRSSTSAATNLLRHWESIMLADLAQELRGFTQ